jgi:hypothetical protein
LLAQIVTKPGRYTFGTDLELGFWIGMARSSTCDYSTAMQGSDDPGPRPAKIAVKGGAVIYDETGRPIGVAVGFSPKSGDVLEIATDTSLPNTDDCEFWNDGEHAPAVPEGSDVPWRDVDKTIGGIDRWKMGQFDYLDAVKQRVNNFDEDQLTQMGLFSCKVALRGWTASTLQHFAHLTSIQADYLVTMSYKYMCPSDQHD